MPVRISCTHCGSGLSMPESMFGKQVRCPKCQQIFTCPSGPEAPAPEPRPSRGGGGGGGNPFAFEEGGAPAAPPARRSRADDDDDDDDRDRGRGRRRSRSRDDDEDDDAPPIRSRSSGGWGGVSRGMMLLTISAGIYVFLFLMFFLLVGSAMGGGGGGGGGIAMAILMGVLFVGATALAAGGLGTMIGVPSSSSVRGIAIAGCISMSVAAVGSFILMVMAFSGSIERSGTVFYLVAICGLQAGFLLTEFLMAILAKHLNKGGLLGSIVGMAAFWAVGPLFFLGATIMSELVGMGGRGMGRDPSSPFMTLLLVFTAAGGWFIANALMLSHAVNMARRKGEI